MKDLDKLYEERKKDLTFEICNVEGVQYNFKLEDIKQIVGVKTKEDLQAFKKYLYYLDVYRCNHDYISSLEDSINKFETILDDDETDKEKIINMFKIHDNMFCDNDGIMRLYLIPKEFDKRIFSI